MNRREWILKSGLVAGSALLLTNCISCMQGETGGRGKHILLVSGWQTVNIGDIAHTPGLIHLLKTYIPGVKITLWPNDIDLVEEKMLISYFPDLTIVKDGFADTGIAGSEDASKCISDADLLLHGSGPGIVGIQKLLLWKQMTSKPYGVFGVTVGSLNEELREVLNGAAFIFTRETLSLDVLSEGGVTLPQLGFAPDATFFLPIRNDASAKFFMESRKLEDRKFICVVPRLRYTPYHRVHTRINWSKEQIDHVIAENLKYVEEDHQKIREVIVRYVRETGNKVVLCPEMEYQTELFEPYLYNLLPIDVQDRVVMHPYWQPDDAASLYARAAVVVSIECHSPIIALVNGTPAIYVRQPSDTIKGNMYYDLKLDDWIFEIEQCSGQQIADRVMEIFGDFDQAIEKVRLLNQRVGGIYDGNMEVVKKYLELV